MKNCHMSHFKTTRQTTKIKHSIAKNLSTDTKLSKVQLSKTIQSGGFFRIMLGNLGKKLITDLATPLPRDNFHGVVSNLASNVINELEKNTRGKGAVRAGKWFTLFISNEDMNDIIKIIKSLEDSNVLIDGITETVKHEIQKQGARYLPPL